MANTYTLIASSTVGSGGASSIDFSSIPATYTDLCLKLSLRTSNNTNARDYFMMRFNGSSSSIYSNRWMMGYDNGSTVSSSGSAQSYQNAFVADANDATASTFGNAEIYFPNYAGSSNKSLSADWVAENNASTFYGLGFTAGLWANTSAINQITIYPSTPTPSGNFVQYSTAYLYGIKNS